jgi:hypothetical protein
MISSDLNRNLQLTIRIICTSAWIQFRSHWLTFEDQDSIFLGNLQNLQLSFLSGRAARGVASDWVTADHQLCMSSGKWTYYMTLGRSLSAGQFSKTCSSALDDIPRLSTPTSAR